MDANPYEAPRVLPGNLQPGTSARPTRASIIGLVLALPFPIILGVGLFAVMMYKHVGMGNEDSPWYTLGFVSELFMCFPLLLVPVTAVLTIVGLAQRPKSGFAWLALFVASIPWFYFLLAFVVSRAFPTQ